MGARQSVQSMPVNGHPASRATASDSHTPASGSGQQPPYRLRDGDSVAEIGRVLRSMSIPNGGSRRAHLLSQLRRTMDDDSSEDEHPRSYMTASQFNRLLRAQHASTSALPGQNGSPTAQRSASTSTRLVSLVGTCLIQYSYSNPDVKCPVCNKTVPSDEAEVHLVMCFTRPRITYNDDVLTETKGECVICFEEMKEGETIARLPCLCVYHKGCIDDWFTVKNTCPEHPGDD